LSILFTKTGRLSLYFEGERRKVVGSATTAAATLDAVASKPGVLWLRWRAPGGSAVPMTVLGDEGERRAAQHLARMGFDLVYQSRASRGAFDLMALRGASHLGLQVKRRTLPLRFSGSEWQRMEAVAARYGWRWAVVAVDPDDGRVRVSDPALATGTRGRRLDEGAEIERLLAWINAPPRRRRDDS